MKPLHWIALCIAFGVTTWFIYRTRETQPRSDTNIDLNWRFLQGDPAGAENQGFDDSEWRYVSLPHDWMIEQQVAEANPSGTAGGFYPGGVAWYRKNLELSDYLNNTQFYLLFEGVQMNSDVYFNGKYLGRQIYGYSSFYHDVTNLVRKDTVNVIAVRTDCSQLPVDRWYSGGGIYRHVKLVATSELHIPIWGSAVTSEIDSNGAARLTVNLELLNNSNRAHRFEVNYDIVDPNGHLIAEAKNIEFIEPMSEGMCQQTFTIEAPELWSPEHPNLYEVNCYLNDRNNRIDRIKTHHGIRTVRFDPDHGFILNGKKVMLKGVCLHHDGGELGASVPVESWNRRFELLKKLGVNAIRFAHNPHAPEVLDLCDRMGFLVIDEMYDKWELSWHDNDEQIAFTETWEEDLTNFIRRDRNHPSVILWSVGNEPVEQLENPGAGIAWYNTMKDLVQAIDPTRQVTAALHPGTPEEGHEVPSSLMQVSPVVSYNYRTDSFRIWHEKYPELVFIATETKAYATQRLKDYQRIDYSGNSWNDMEEFVAGQFIWAGIDYLGESAGWPDRGLRNGLLLTNGFIKPHAWYIGSRYSEDPMVKLTVKDSLLADSLNRRSSWQTSWAGAPLVDHWSFDNQPGPKDVVVFTNCENVEVRLNDRLISNIERSRFPDGVIKLNVPYEKGELVAHAFYRDSDGDVRSVSDTLTSSHNPYKLLMFADRNQVNSGTGEVVHITTRVVDSTGVLNPHSDHMVNYDVEGPGRIRVIDNGDLSDHTPYASTSRKVKQGKQLLILQAGVEPGDLIVNATSEGLHPSQVKIKSKD